MNFKIQNSIQYMRGRIPAYGIVLSVFVIIGCGDPADTSFFVEPEQRLHSIEVNYPAVNLALVPPHDTVTLQIIARNVLGDQVTDGLDVKFSTTSSQVVVTPAGLVRALAQTSVSGVSIMISATYKGVTLTDKAQIVVTNVALPPVMADFSFGRSHTDTLEISPVTGFGKAAPTIKPVAVTDSGAIIPRLIFAYQSSNNGAIAVSFMSRPLWQPATSGIPLTPGYQIGVPAVIRAKARVYGVAMVDSIIVRGRKEPDFASVILFDTMTTIPPDIELYRGGDVYWVNTSFTNKIGITFDEPDKVKAPSPETFAAMLFWTWLPDSGDIAPFIRDTTLASREELPLPAHTTMVRGRSFPEPGRYRWHTTGGMSIEGTIIVR